MMIFFATSTVTSVDWANIIIPAAISLVVSILGVWGLLSKYREKVDQLEKIDAQKRLSSLEGRFEALQSQVNSLQQNSPSNFVKTESPMSLTDNGKQLLEDSGIKKFIDDNFDSLLAELQNTLSPKGNDYSAYDVHTIALDTVISHADDKDFLPVKDYAFKEGSNLENIQLVGGIYLRDKCLESLGFDLASYYSSTDDGQSHHRKQSS
ncbi:MAG TPA: hypothetical protein VIH90_04165 [Candidatus Saccharimonadales bacterium]